MARANQDAPTDWTEVIAKCLCFVALKQSDVSNGTLLQRAGFLAGLGLSKADRAAILGTTSDSLSELERQSRKRKNAKKKK